MSRSPAVSLTVTLPLWLDDPRLDDLPWPSGFDRQQPADEAFGESLDSEIRQRVGSWADAQRHLTIEEAAADVVGALLQRVRRSNQAERWTPVLVARFGLSGRAPVTLEVAGTLIDVTRERVRQVESDVVRALPAHPVFFPSLDNGLALASSSIHTPQELSDALADSEVTGTQWDARALVATARLFGRSCQLEIKDGLVSADFSLIKAIRKACHDQTGRYGVSHVGWIAAELADSKAIADPKVIVNVLEKTGYDDLGEGWWWDSRVPAGRNRLINVTRNLFCVADELTIEEIAQAATRYYRFRHIAQTPPPSAVGRVLNQHPDFSVANGHVRCNASIDPALQLGEVTRKLVEVMRSFPGQLFDRVQLVAGLFEAGVPEGTANVWTTYNELIEKVAPNVYCMLGTRPSPADVTAVQDQSARRLALENPRIELGWSPNGKRRVVARIGSGALLSGTLPLANIPTEFGDQRFRVRDVHGDEHGVVSMSGDHNFIWGLRPYFLASGIAAAAVIEMEFDIGESECRVRVVDDSAFDS